MRRMVRRPSPAMVVALVALFVALGGVAYGVAENSIGTRAIKDGGVLSRDVKDGALQARDVKDGSLLGSDLKDGSVRGAEVHDATLGGLDVADGSLRGRDLASNAISDREIDETKLDIQRLAGYDAKRYIRNVRQVRVETANDATTPKVAPPAACPRRTRLLGGGAHVVTPTPIPVAIGDNGPSGDAWTASAYATAPTGSWQLVVIAICG
jgi:hypothetical protein